MGKTRITAVALLAVGAWACSESATGTREKEGPSFSNAGGQDSSGGASHYTANGIMAQVSWSFGSFDSITGIGSFEFGSVTVQEIGAVNNEAVWLSYFIQRCDPAGCSLPEAGDGMVPRGSLSGGSKTARLDVTPAGVPGFNVWAGSGGPVRITWAQDGMFSSRNSGNSQTTTRFYSVRSNGVWESASAAAIGVVGSSAIPAGSSASVGKNHNVTLFFSH